MSNPDKGSNKTNKTHKLNTPEEEKHLKETDFTNPFHDKAFQLLFNYVHAKKNQRNREIKIGRDRCFFVGERSVKERKRERADGVEDSEEIGERG